MSDQHDTEMHTVSMPPGEIYSAARTEFQLSEGGQVHSWMTDRGMAAVSVGRYPSGSLQLSLTFEQWDALFAAVDALRPKAVSS